MTTTLENVPPDKVERNPENPRIHFREAAMNRLAESVEEASGILVPIYVYRHPEAADTFVLIDGERRWRVAQRLGHETLPALVRDDPPEPAANIVEMFNIHKVREDWEEMPTARALQQVIERTGVTDPSELRQLTGLSREQIGRFTLLLDLPTRYQNLVEDGTIPMNFFVELDRNVIQPLIANRAGLAAAYPPDALRDAFLAKRDAGALHDLIDLRRVKPIIQRAGVEAGSRDALSPLDGAIRRLLDEPDVTIDEVYDESVAFAIETDKLAARSQQLADQFGRALARSRDQAERDSILELVRVSRDALDALLPEH